jgi:iron-sulfur cluster insertion protein
MNTAMNQFNATPPAIRRVETLAQKDGRDNLSLRVYITGGGCAGFQYGFVFEDSPGDDELTFAVDAEAQNDTEKAAQASIVIDPLSFTYLKGATLDYEVGLRGAHFVIRNPNADTTCGCGASFSINPDAP